MNKQLYIPRLVDKEISSALQRAGAVLITGPKACGKTMTGRKLAASEIQLDTVGTGAEVFSSHPDLALNGATPRLIDEWQIVPSMWNAIRHEVDKRGLKNQFILCGSSSPADDLTRHSGAGRISRIRMRPVTLFESGISNATVSLCEIFEGLEFEPSSSDITINTFIELMCSGGWPTNFGLDTTSSMMNVRDYLEESTRIDIAKLDNERRSRDPLKIAAVIRSIARNSGSPLTTKTIIADVNDEGGSVSPDTVRSYLDALERVMLLEPVPSWSTHLRSSVTLRTRPKLYLADPSLVVASLRASPSTLQRDPKTIGLIVETLVMRDLLVYAQNNDAVVSYYRDSNDLEVDAVIERRDGTWIGVEIKLSPEAVDQAATKLLRFASKIDTTKKGEAAALVVVTATGYAFKRKDGILVVPIGCLAP